MNGVTYDLYDYYNKGEIAKHVWKAKKKYDTKETGE